MRQILRIAAVVMGLVGVLVCAAAIGIGWWAASRTTAAVDRVADRIDGGLSGVDKRLAKVESRVKTVCTDLDTVRGGAAATVDAENPELPRIRTEIETLSERLMHVFDRAETIADSLGSVAVELRTVANVVEQFKDDAPVAVGTRKAADRIDTAAESLNGLRARVDAMKSVKAAQMTQEIVALAREAIAGSERLADGLAAARQAIELTSTRAATLQDDVVAWIRVAAAAITIIALWSGLGQLCLFQWGRRPRYLPRGEQSA